MGKCRPDGLRNCHRLAGLSSRLSPTSPGDVCVCQSEARISVVNLNAGNAHPAQKRLPDIDFRKHLVIAIQVELLIRLLRPAETTCRNLANRCEALFRMVLECQGKRNAAPWRSSKMVMLITFVFGLNMISSQEDVHRKTSQQHRRR